MRSCSKWGAALAVLVALSALTVEADARPGALELRSPKAASGFFPGRLSGAASSRNRSAGQAFANNRTREIRWRIADKISRSPIAHVNLDLTTGRSTALPASEVRFRSSVVVRSLGGRVPTELRRVTWTTKDRAVSGTAMAVTRLLPGGKPMTRLSAFDVTRRPRGTPAPSSPR